MNILITSVGRRSYLVRYFQEALKGKGEVHVSNSSERTPAFNCAKKSVVTPMIYDKDYIPFLLDYCCKNHIKAILSVFDVDLPILAANRTKFEEKGIKVIVSDEKVLRICNDKLKTYEFLIKEGFKAPKTYSSLEEAYIAINKKLIQFPLIIKPRWGMGSIAMYQADDHEELKILYHKVKKDIKNSYLKYESEEDFENAVIIQEKLLGQEFGLDIINDLEGNYVHTVVKKKYAMRSGETDCAKTIKESCLSNLGERLSNRLGHIGNLDVDIFMGEKGPYVLEMNARFGGGYPFSHLAGINLPLAIIKWINGDNKDIDKLFKEEPNVMGHKEIEMVRLSNG